MISALAPRRHQHDGIDMEAIIDLKVPDTHFLVFADRKVRYVDQHGTKERAGGSRAPVHPFRGRAVVPVPHIYRLSRRRGSVRAPGRQRKPEAEASGR